MTRLTQRDLQVMEDVAKSHALLRGHLLKLGYFTSVTRLNTRMRELVGLGLVRRLETPFFNESLYIVSPKWGELLSPELAGLIKSRPASPRFLRHCLAVSDMRIALTKRSGGKWLFEHELWRTVDGNQVRPDGAIVGKSLVLIEVDLGNVSLPKFKQKLFGYQTLASSGQCQRLYGHKDFRLLVVTSGKRRARHLSRLLPSNPGFGYLVETFESLGVALTPSWS